MISTKKFWECNFAKSWALSVQKWIKWNANFFFNKSSLIWLLKSNYKIHIDTNSTNLWELKIASYQTQNGSLYIRIANKVLTNESVCNIHSFSVIFVSAKWHSASLLNGLRKSEIKQVTHVFLSLLAFLNWSLYNRKKKKTEDFLFE